MRPALARSWRVPYAPARECEERSVAMTARAVVAVVAQLSAAGVTAWPDGGWGSDALVGEQTRPHADLDLVIGSRDVAVARAARRARGFTAIEDELPTRFVMADRGGQRVAYHPVTFDGEGGGVQRLQDGATWCYPPAGFRGTGWGDGRGLRCLTPEVQCLRHLGWSRTRTTATTRAACTIVSTSSCPRRIAAGAPARHGREWGPRNPPDPARIALRRARSRRGSRP